jgi:hypothetical protein
MLIPLSTGGYLLPENKVILRWCSPRVAPKKITKNKKALHFCKALILKHKFGGYGETRTCDPSIMSAVL